MQQTQLSDKQALEAKKFKKLQSTFIRNVEHKLRTPITIIQGFSELLSTGAIGALDPEQESAIFAIHNRAGELRTFIERITTFMAVQTLAVATETFDLKDIAARALEARRAEAEQAGLTLAMPLPAAPAPVRAQAYHLQQAVDCLVENALKFTPAGGRVEIKTGAADGQVCLSVVDTGVGIDKEEQAHIFDAFYQVDTLPVREYGGAGLGLAVVKSVAQAYSGQVEVKSKPGKGSRFTIKMPAAASAPKPAEMETTIKQRILIVDDEEFVALTLQAGLENMPNCEIVTATQGKQALQLFKRQPFDLLLTDYKMPGMDGLALAAQVSRQYPQTVIIMITAYSDDELNRQASGISIQRILDKPVTFNEIRRAASAALGRPQNT